MIEIASQWKSVTDRGKWATRGASFVAKAKATKVVWFPPKPEETGKKAGSAAKKATKTTTGKTTAAVKTASGTKKVSRPTKKKP
jgi:hypothetical protein